jgi:hypothetical protein
LIWHYEKINCPGGSISCIGIKIIGQKHIWLWEPNTIFLKF